MVATIYTIQVHKREYRQTVPTINYRWNRSLIIHVGEEYKFLVYKLSEGDFLCLFTVQNFLLQTFSKHKKSLFKRRKYKVTKCSFSSQVKFDNQPLPFRKCWKL